jgi:hypothetical protein
MASRAVISGQTNMSFRQGPWFPRFPASAMPARKEAKMSKASFSSPQSGRVSKVIPVFVYGSMEDGATFQELAQTVVVDVGGGIIELEAPVANGMRLLAVNENTNKDVECSVVCTQGSRNGKGATRHWQEFLNPLSSWNWTS